MPRTGVPNVKTRESHLGAPSSYTLDGPPERTYPFACLFSRRSHGVSCGRTSQYTLHSRMRRAIRRLVLRTEVQHDHRIDPMAAAAGAEPWLAQDRLPVRGGEGGGAKRLSTFLHVADPRGLPSRRAHEIGRDRRGRVVFLRMPLERGL